MSIVRSNSITSAICHKQISPLMMILVLFNKDRTFLDQI